MTDQTQARALSKTERAHLDALASEFDFWSDVRERSADFDNTLTAAQYARFCEALEKYPSILAGKPVRNRRAKDGSIYCWRSREKCRSVATEVVDRVGVCSAHVEAQRADAARYAAARPPKPVPVAAPAEPYDPEAARERQRQAERNLVSMLLGPDDDGGAAA